ncbi:hypothetical protein CV102_00935 [Natronococcus pandeyae]|uniref:Uncharacterized protein n=1 Tax=Natronococcus pandeyae TaxID=2055836 RepID=A0A8J8TS32_9EURY|nr:hypothetical protein [Natronococcus pandeyae]TYL40178.1 hypothetical protein CV102_00935 [Natronococcus pandeyae]
MKRENVHNSDPTDIADELVQIGFHSEREANAFVYFVIMDPPKQDAGTVFNISEDELEDELESAEALFKQAEKTIEVSNNVEKPGERVDTLIGAGLLSEAEVEAYIHSDRLDDSALVDFLDEPVSIVEQNKERAEEKIDRAHQLMRFRDKYSGFQIR